MSQSMESAVVSSSGMDSTESPVDDCSKSYDVFLSHRGPDTKKDFVSFLYKELKHVGLQPFLDMNDIDKGKDSWDRIEGVLKRKLIALVIFSKGFAGSEWCLRELHLILENPEITMIPIFYKVRPSDLLSPEKLGFQEIDSSKFGKAVVEEWRADLNKASTIGGSEYREEDNRTVVDVVKEVVDKVLELVGKPLPLYVAEHPIGVQPVAEEIIQKLDEKKYRMLGLVGMGGIGKSTLAKELCNQLCKRYAASCYVEDVKEKVKVEGVVSIQKRLLHDLCGAVYIEDQSKGRTILEDRLQKKQFLLVLDDVKDEDMMEYIVSHKMLMGGSLCIVTSRSTDVFQKFSSGHRNEIYIHEVGVLSSEDSEQLFRAHAFGGDDKESLESPKRGRFRQLVRDISEACGGVPLVLKVIGCRLNGNDELAVWEETKKSLSSGGIMTERKIFECLRISYDALEDEHQEMFVEIACALVGQSKDFAVCVWDSRGWHPLSGISELVKKGLVSIDYKGCFNMHDHLRDMGRKIERGREEGKRKHLWMPEALALLKADKQFPGLQTLVICRASKHEVDGSSMELAQTKELRILLCDDTINVISVPATLLWLQIREWHVDREGSNFESENGREYSVKGSIVPKIISSVPENNELMVLDIHTPYHSLEAIKGKKGVKYLLFMCMWMCKEVGVLPNSFRSLKKLKKLKLNNSGIESLPDSIGELTNLEELDMDWCSELSVLPDSIGGLKKLKKLRLFYSGIESLPDSIGELTNLEELDIAMCWELSVLPDSFGGLKKLKKLRLSRSGIGSLPDSIGELTNLEDLDMYKCRELSVLPDSIGGLKKLKKLWLSNSGIESLRDSIGELTNLEELNMSWCRRLSVLPDSIGGLKKLKRLGLSWSGIESLPDSIGELTNLEELDMADCSKLSVLPDSFGGLKKLKKLRLSWSGIESLPDSIGELTNLEELDMTMCMELSVLPDSFGGLKKLKKLRLFGSGIENLPDSIGELTNLEELHMFNCKRLSVLPDSIGGLKKLKKLWLSWSGIESLPDSIGELTNLEELVMEDCVELSVLPDSFGGLKKLKLKLWGSGIESLPDSIGELTNLEDCVELSVLPDSFGGLKKLKKLWLFHSGIKSLPDSIGELTNLEELHIAWCSRLSVLPDSFGGLKKVKTLSLSRSGIESLPDSIGELTNLEELDMEDCGELSVLPDSFGGLKKLKTLSLSRSGIESLPDSIGELSNLEELDMAYCWELSVLPDSFGGLKKLKKLRLSRSGIGSLPDSIGELTNLEELDMADCRELSVLPDSIGGLKKLKKLRLSWSGIESLPDSIGELTNLEELDMDVRN